MQPRFRERLFPGWLWRLSGARGQVALTFDDGPDPATTPMLLAELSRLEIPATHFMTGLRCERYPEHVIAAARLGHVVANHGYEHRSVLWCGTERQQESIARTGEVIAAISGSPSTLYRPCHGHFNPWTRRALGLTRHRGVLWSILVDDWRPQSDERLRHRLLSSLHDGAIIVLHDARPTTPAVIRLLPHLAQEVASRGWRFVPLSNATVTSPTEPLL